MQFRNVLLILCRGGSTLTTFCSCLNVSLQSSFTGFFDPSLGSKSHLAAARKKQELSSKPPLKDLFKSAVITFHPATKYF